MFSSAGNVSSLRWVGAAGRGNYNSCRCESSFSGQHRDGRKSIFHFVAPPELEIWVRVQSENESYKDQLLMHLEEDDWNNEIQWIKYSKEKKIAKRNQTALTEFRLLLCTQTQRNGEIATTKLSADGKRVSTYTSLCGIFSISPLGMENK